MKLTVPQILKPSLVATTLALAAPAMAHENHDTPTVLPPIAPGASYEVTVQCPHPHSEYVVSGGVQSLDQLRPTGPLVVTASYPSSTRSWTVELTNRSGRPTSVGEATIVVTALCRYRH